MSEQQVISLREYFAAHAPAEIPFWFECEPSEPKPEFPKWESLPEPLQASARNWLLDPCYDLEGPELAAFQAAVARAREALNEWDQRRSILRYFAWRWHYANCMVLTRDKNFSRKAR